MDKLMLFIIQIKSMHLIWGYGKELKWETTVLWLQRLCLLRVLTDPGPSRYRPPDSGAV